MKAIFKRELSSYFKSPLGYVFLGLFISYSALMFMFSTVPYQTSNMGNYFISVCYIFILAVPLLTMKMFSEERKQKTDQLWLTAPVKVSSVVMGKFLSGLSVLAIGVAATLVFLAFLALYGNPAVLQSLVGYVGVLLYGAALIAIGIFVSALTESQVVAAVLGIVVSLLVLYIDNFAAMIPVEWISSAVSALSFRGRFEAMAVGIFDVSNILFFISIAGIFLFLTERALERRRWA